jgi:hypothetical protein
MILPLTGVWVADVVAEAENAQGVFPTPGASCSVTFGTTSFQGTVRRSSNPFGTVFARLVGGAGGLPTKLEPKSYQNTTAQNVLNDLLSDCGEKLAPSSDQGILNQALGNWVRLAAPAWQSLAVLMDWVNPNGTWRVLPNGQTWVGVDTYPPTTMQSAELLGYFPHRLEAEIFSDTPTILPGQSYLGGEVSSVTHEIEPDHIVSKILFLDQQLASVVAANG